MDLFEETGMRGLANKLGLRYCGYPRDEDYRAETGGLPNLPLLTELGERDVSDLMYGRLNHANVQVFNASVTPYEPDPRHPRRSVVAVTFAADFPRLLVEPHTRMTRLRQSANWRGLRELPAAFKERFNVDAADKEVAGAVLGTDLCTWLTHQQLDLRLELQGGALLGHCPELDDTNFTELIDAVIGAHMRFPQAAWADYSLFKL
ncbi:MAG: hypothetical protein U5R31_11910 [Acidimicrobiia bacterium]|nr:hypothetical protein [Acidimicrobiia bacterium]